MASATGLRTPFVLDDNARIVDNQDLRDTHHLLSKLFVPHGSTGHDKNDPSRPLVYLLYTGLYQTGQLTPFPYHLANALLHALAAILVFLVTCALQRHLIGSASTVPACLVALTFAVLPINIGTVVYAYGTSDVLSATLILLSLYLFVRREAPTRAALTLATVSLVLALASKQSSVIAPFLILLFDALFITRDAAAWRSRWRTHVPGFAVVLVYLALRYAQLGQLGDVEADQLKPWGPYVLAQPLVFFRYVTLSFFPSGLVIDHDVAPDSASLALRILALFALVGIVAAVLLRLRRHPTPRTRVLAFAIGLSLIALAPTSLLPTADVMVERRMYLASFGLALLAVLLWDLASLGFLAQVRRPRVLAGFVAYLTVLACASLLRIQTFRSPERIWRAVLETYPKSRRAMNSLAFALIAHHRLDEAEKWLKDATALGGGNMDQVYLWVGRLRAERGELVPAQADLEEAVRLNPRLASAQELLGELLWVKGQHQAAEEHLRAALDLDPTLAERVAHIREDAP